MDPIALALLALIVGGMAARSRFPRLPTWSLMSLAAFVGVVAGPGEVDDVLSAINFEVLLFLVGMFSIVALAESSGLLDAVALWFLGRFRRTRTAYVGASLLFGLLAAVAVNDTVAVMGPPIAAAMARAMGVDPRALFLLLAFSLTVGSAMTPMGNPQNVLVAVASGMKAPLLAFLARLAVPTLINLAATALLLARAFRLPDRPVALAAVPWEAIRDRRDAAVAAAALAATVGAMAANDALALAGAPHIEHIGVIPFVAASAVYFLARDPRAVLARVEWGTIVFFATMFVAMDAVWRGGVLQPLLEAALPHYGGGPRDIAAIAGLSLALSQLLSNVPFVQLFSTHLQQLHADERAWLALAASSTVAGNLTLLGAASNIIILEVLERRYGHTITFVQFLRYGLPVTALNMAIYFPFLLL